MEHTPRFVSPQYLQALRVLVLLAVVAPIIAQNEERPYFSLSSSRTFGSQDKPQIQLSGYNVKAVQIRVYRVNDPVEFYRKLENTHMFGGTPPTRPGKPTLIESIHRWKRQLRASIRRGLRGQFTESPSAHFRAKPAPATVVRQPAPDYFAQAPLLNPDQLVLTLVHPVSTGANWNSSQVPIAVKEKGVYLIEAVGGALRAYTIVTVSDLVLVTKVGREHVLAFVADRKSGEPLKDIAVKVTQRNGTPVTDRTNDLGMVDLPKEQQQRGARLIAMRDRDVAFGELPDYSIASRAANWVGYLYTDRPVYRPGDTTHFRGIMRVAEAVGYRVPDAQDVSVQITDPDGKTVYQETVRTNARGTLHGEYALPKDAALGHYYLQVKAGESTANGEFEVEEYKKPEYEVRVTPASRRVLQGAEISATIDARYYFGEPVHDATVKYAVYRSRYYFPLWRDPDEAPEQESDAQDDEAAGDQVTEGQGKLDVEGKLTVHFKTPISEHKYDYRYRIEARVTDEARREISGTGYALATYGSIIVNGEPERYLLRASALENFTISARDYDSKPVAVDVRVQLLRWNWREHKSDGVEASASAHISGQGSTTLQLRMPDRGGSFRLKVLARSPEGRDVESLSYVWIPGGGEESFYGAASHSLQIVPDKKTYRLGDVARILIASGELTAPVLVSVEGRDVRSYKLLRPASGSALFEYTVSGGDEPGFFVSAQSIQGGELYSGSKRVKVPPNEHKLNIALSTDKPQYLPGQTAGYKMQVTSFDGKPVANADLSLGVVDEAIYAIRPDRAGDIIDFFYGNTWNSVFTETSLQFYFSGEAGTRRMELAHLRPASQLAQLKPERLVQPKIRKAFPDTAFWNADLLTDGNGEARASVAFPDSLTTWRATVRGATANQQFGSAQLKTIVRKNLMLRLAVPRFLVQGDEAVISGIAHNYLQTAKHARVSLRVQGVEMLTGATQDVDIPVRGEARVDWRVKTQTLRQATFTAEALTDEESDALEQTLPVRPQGVQIRQSQSGTLLNSATRAAVMTFPQEAQPSSRSLVVRTSPSVAASLFGALEYLTSYPYGCVEQTMSSFLPDLMVSKAVTELKLKQPMDPAALKTKIEAGRDRLYGFQHQDGGWGWWESDESHPFMTAYVVAGLTDARNAGIEVKNDVLERGAGWLKARLANKAVNDAPDLQAYIAYALANFREPQIQAIERLFGARAQLSPYGTALLGLTLERINDNRAVDVANDLQRSAQQNEAEAWWPASRDAMLDFEADTTPEATAFAMKFLSHQKRDSALLPKAALWLVNHRNEGYWWSTTKQTAMVIYGLIDYLKLSNELHPNTSIRVVVNGTPAIDARFDDQTSSELTATLDDSKLRPGANQIVITTSGQGRTYYSFAAAHFSNEAKEEKQARMSLNVLRDYFLLQPAKDGERTVYDLAPLSGSVSSGDTLAVRLTVTGSDWKYLLAEDPIPAGTEFIERDNLYQIRSRPPWWRYLFTRRELHDDRMALFQTEFGEGQQQFFYLLKVVNPGLFHVGPARVGPMYQPQIQATSESRTLEVK